MISDFLHWLHGLAGEIKEAIMAKINEAKDAAKAAAKAQAEAAMDQAKAAAKAQAQAAMDQAKEAAKEAAKGAAGSAGISGTLISLLMTNVMTFCTKFNQDGDRETLGNPTYKEMAK